MNSHSQRVCDRNSLVESPVARYNQSEVGTEIEKKEFGLC